MIEKEGHDSEEVELDLAQATSYPLEDKHLVPISKARAHGCPRLLAK